MNYQPCELRFSPVYYVMLLCGLVISIGSSLPNAKLLAPTSVIAQGPSVRSPVRVVKFYYCQLAHLHSPICDHLKILKAILPRPTWQSIVIQHPGRLGLGLEFLGVLPPAINPVFTLVIHTESPLHEEGLDAPIWTGPRSWPRQKAGSGERTGPRIQPLSVSIRLHAIILAKPYARMFHDFALFSNPQD